MCCFGTLPLMVIAFFEASREIYERVEPQVCGAGVSRLTRGFAATGSALQTRCCPAGSPVRPRPVFRRIRLGINHAILRSGFLRTAR